MLYKCIQSAPTTCMREPEEARGYNSVVQFYSSSLYTILSACFVCTTMEGVSVHVPALQKWWTGTMLRNYHSQGYAIPGAWWDPPYHPIGPVPELEKGKYESGRNYLPVQLNKCCTPEQQSKSIIVSPSM